MTSANLGHALVDAHDLTQRSMSMRQINYEREYELLGIPFRYLLRHPVVALWPEIWTTIHDSYMAQRERRRPQCRFESNEDWEQQLHQALCVPWPCYAASEFWDLWPRVISELEAKGIQPWPGELSGLE
jgi:hypothetical protein